MSAHLSERDACGDAGGEHAGRDKLAIDGSLEQGKHLV
jgi:hypothetical protein